MSPAYRMVCECSDSNAESGDDMKKILSFDAETDGLWGQPFAIGALVYDESGNVGAPIYF